MAVAVEMYAAPVSAAQRLGKHSRVLPIQTILGHYPLSQLGLQPGDCAEVTDLLFTAQGLGPVLIGAIWERGQKQPLLLVTNLDFLDQAHFWYKNGYKKRFGIETFFSDQKSRGFYLCHSHLSQPERLSRLLMATCLAYYWMVCLGAEVWRQGGQALFTGPNGVI